MICEKLFWYIIINYSSVNFEMFNDFMFISHLSIKLTQLRF